MAVQLDELIAHSELFKDDRGPLPARVEIYRSADNQICLKASRVTDENQLETELDVYLTDAEASRLAHMLGCAVLDL